MTYVNVNKVFRDVALEQEIEVGSYQWREGGMEPYSGTTGGHAAYGWSSSWRLNQNDWWHKAVIANYAARPSFYNQAPYRQVSYEAGGRPVGWTPQEAGDLPDGMYAYLTSSKVVAVSGPEPSHFNLQPLIALLDAKDLYIKCQGQNMPVSWAARLILMYLMNSFAGMLKQSNGDYHFFSDRGSSLVVGMATEAGIRNAMIEQDYPRFVDYLENKLIPYYSNGCGFEPSHKVEVLAPNKYVQFYNGLFWLLPRFFDASKYCSGDMKTAIDKILVRWSNYMLQIHEMNPEASTKAAGIIASPDLFMLKEPPIDLKPYIVDFYYTYDWTLWGLRAQYVAAKVLDNQTMLNVALANTEKLKPTIYEGNNRSWFYDADMNPLF